MMNTTNSFHVSGLLAGVLAVICTLRLPAQSPEPFIIGGAQVDITTRPFQVKFELNGDQFCGCSIINREWLLTAAHCVLTDFRNPNSPMHPFNEMEFFVGSNSADDPLGRRHTADQIIIDPAYGWPDNDFALVHLAAPIDFDDRVQPVRLRNDDADPGDRAVVSGWGRTAPNGGDISDVLLAVNVPVLSRPAAETAFEQLGFDFDVEANMVPTGVDPDDTEGSCNGDSGGPMTTLDNQGRVNLTGVVSWGAPGCPAGAPSVYANVQVARDWILRETCLQDDRLDYNVFNDLQVITGNMLEITANVTLDEGTQSEFRAENTIIFEPGAHVVAEQEASGFFRIGSGCNDNTIELKVPEHHWVADGIQDLIMLSPNPASLSTGITVPSSATLPLELWMYATDGSVILQRMLTEDYTSVSLENVPQGIIALCAVDLNGSVFSGRLVRQ